VLLPKQEKLNISLKVSISNVDYFLTQKTKKSENFFSLFIFSLKYYSSGG